MVFSRDLVIEAWVRVVGLPLCPSLHEIFKIDDICGVYLAADELFFEMRCVGILVREEAPTFIQIMLGD